MTESDRARTWRLRQEANDLEARALADLVAAKEEVARCERVYFAAIQARRDAVAANITAARGYPCDWQGYPITTVDLGDPG